MCEQQPLEVRKSDTCNGVIKTSALRRSGAMAPPPPLDNGSGNPELWKCINNFWHRSDSPPSGAIDPSSIHRILRRNSSFDKYNATFNPQYNSKVLVLYTGGTIGMTRNSSGALVCTPKAMEGNVRMHPSLHDNEYAAKHFGKSTDAPMFLPDVREKRRVAYTIYEYEPLLDSSNMTMDDWIRIANDLKEAYELFDGFVVLHGTDTMAYTASALSFMLENLGKAVIITGSQIPLFECRSDGRDNFLGALILAGNYCIPEVSVYFGNRLFRGNRTTKISVGSLSAFDSPNCPPLVNLGIHIQVDYKGIFRPTVIKKFSVHGKLNRNVGLLRLFPSITVQTVQAFLSPPTQGVVLQTYGAGNVPSNRMDIMNALKKASKKGVLIVNCTQCSSGSVVAEYETGMALVDMGVISGLDMTPEAALTKLSYVLAKDEWDINTKRKMMQSNLRGEMTLFHRKIQELELLHAVARSLHISTSEEVDRLRDLLAPSLLCAAAAKGDMAMLEAVRNYGADISSGDFEGRTPLHVASREGNAKLVENLLLNGASIHVKDRRGNTPIMDAIEFDQYEVITLLRNCGAHLNQNQKEICDQISCYVAQGNIRRLQSFQMAGISFDMVDSSGRTPLHVAVECNQEECINFLRGYKVKETIPNKLNQTPLQLAKALGYNHLLSALQDPIDVDESK